MSSNTQSEIATKKSPAIRRIKKEQKNMTHDNDEFMKITDHMFVLKSDQLLFYKIDVNGRQY
jgi:hypothetical protein